MSSPHPDPRPAPPIAVPLKQWQFDLFWGVATLLSIAVVAGVVATARTSGGRIAGGLAFGAMLAACVLAWADVHRHPPQLQVSDAAIIRTYKGRPDTTTSLLKAGGAELVFVLVRRQRGAHWALAQPGRATRVDVQSFKTRTLLDACRTRGWRIQDGPGPRH